MSQQIERVCVACTTGNMSVCCLQDKQHAQNTVYCRKGAVLPWRFAHALDGNRALTMCHGPCCLNAELLTQLQAGEVSAEFKKKMAWKAYQHTASYDAQVGGSSVCDRCLQSCAARLAVAGS